MVELVVMAATMARQTIQLHRIALTKTVIIPAWPMAAAIGHAGMITVFVKAILCNWMVCLAIVAAMTTNSTIGKIACAYMPVFIFFAQGFEHSVVNMFLIPTGMMMGAKITVTDWWLWNQIPVTLGNLVGGFIFPGLAIYMTHKPRKASVAPLT